LGLLTRLALRLIAVVLGLTACSSPPKVADPPANFPDLSAFTAVDSKDRSFRTSEGVYCDLDFGPRKVIVCRGRIRGPLGRGCPYVEKPGDSPDTPYQFFMSGPGGCANDRMMYLAAGQKMVGKNGTCAVGDGELIACIDADHKHGFVLQPSDGWSF
jgi:hypothetical protein